MLAATERVKGFHYYPAFLQPGLAGSLLNNLWQGLNWKSQEILLFGKKVRQPRLTAWCSDPGVVYRYSGLELRPASWHPELENLRFLLRRSTGRHFNSVLVNAYRDGRDSMGWHADNEKELGINPTIASVSLGATRRFLVRLHSGGRSCAFDLENGSLMVMDGDSQHRWQHCIPKTKKKTGLRINLTFRQILE